MELSEYDDINSSYLHLQAKVFQNRRGTAAPTSKPSFLTVKKRVMTRTTSPTNPQRRIGGVLINLRRRRFRNLTKAFKTLSQPSLTLAKPPYRSKSASVAVPSTSKQIPSRWRKFLTTRGQKSLNQLRVRNRCPSRSTKLRRRGRST